MADIDSTQIFTLARLVWSNPNGEHIVLPNPSENIQKLSKEELERIVAKSLPEELSLNFTNFMFVAGRLCFTSILKYDAEDNVFINTISDKLFETSEFLGKSIAITSENFTFSILKNTYCNSNISPLLDCSEFCNNFTEALRNKTGRKYTMKDISFIMTTPFKVRFVIVEEL